jgi:hypothetical protein
MSTPHKETVAAYRTRMRAKGLRPVQFWVVDTRNPEFAKELNRQCQILNDTPDEIDAIRFCEDAAKLIEGWE